jgi:hypothetical protein
MLIYLFSQIHNNSDGEPEPQVVAKFDGARDRDAKLSGSSSCLYILHDLTF